MENEPLYLTAREAAAELSISPASLYAYVSRGLIRSEPSPDCRNHRYRAEDVRALKARRSPRGDSSAFNFDADFPLLDSAISTFTEEGPLYRGVPSAALAQTASLEHVATLLWDAADADPFSDTNLPIVSPAMSHISRAAAAAAPVDRTVALLALAGEADPRAFNRVPEGRAAVGARILRLVASAMTGAPPSAVPIHTQIARHWRAQSPHAEDLLRRALVLLADHELNASTFTVRCAVSTGISLYDAVIAGLVAVKGPRHGGAGARGAQFVAQLRDGDAGEIIRERVALGERLPGFGHGIYTKGDPRARELLAALGRAGAEPMLVHDVPAKVLEATGEAANIDYALAVLTTTLGMPTNSELPLFAVARTVGWIAHAMEQLQTGGLIRPRARYIGPAPGRMAAVKR